MSEINRDFKGVWIPKEIWLDIRLNALDKIIFTEISSLDIGEKGCYASNKYLAEFCQCSESKVSKSISTLTKLGYIECKVFDGRQRKLKVCLVKNARLPSKIYEADSQNMLDINIDNNKTNNIDNKEIYKEKNDNAKIIEKPKERKNKKKEKIINLLEKHYDEYGIDNEIVIEKLEKFFSNMLDDNRMVTDDMIIATLTSLAKVSPDTQIKAIQLSLDKGYKSISPDYLNSSQGNFKPNNTYHNSNEIIQSQSDYNKQLDEYKNKNLKTF